MKYTKVKKVTGDTSTITPSQSGWAGKGKASDNKGGSKREK